MQRSNIMTRHLHKLRIRERDNNNAYCVKLMIGMMYETKLTVATTSNIGFRVDEIYEETNLYITNADLYQSNGHTSLQMEERKMHV